MAGLNDVVVLNIGTRRAVVASATMNQDLQKLDNIKILADKEFSGLTGFGYVNEKTFSKEMALVLKSAKNQYGKSFEKIHIGVPGSFLKVSVKNVIKQFPGPTKITQQDVADVIKNGSSFPDVQGYQVVSVSPAYYNLDKSIVSSVIGKQCQTMQVTLSCVLCEKNFMDKIFATLSEVEFTNKDKVEFISQEFATCVTLFSESTRDNTLILCNVDELATTVAIGRGDGLLSSSSFNIGGSKIVSYVYETLQLPSYTEAEKLVYSVNVSQDNKNLEPFKVKYKNEYYDVPVSSVVDLVKEKLDEVAKNILKIMSEFKYDAPPHLPIYLVGGGLIKIKGSDDYIASKVNRKVKYEYVNDVNMNKIPYTPAISILKLVAKSMKVEKQSFIEKIKKILKIKK